MKKRGNRVGFAMMLALVFTLAFSVVTLAAGKKTFEFAGHYQKYGTGRLYYWQTDLGDYSTTAYYKVYVPKTGRLEVSGLMGSSLSYGGYICLCDNKFQTVEVTSEGQYVKDGSTHSFYGVNQGTYYLRVKNQRYVAAACIWTPMSDNGGASQGSAYELKRNVQYNGVMPIGENYSRADFYKIKLTKAGQIRLYLSVKGTGLFSVYFYGGKTSMRIGQYTKYDGGVDIFMKSSLGTISNLPAGTYYVKIMRTGENRYKRSSGAYWLKWNYK